MLNAIARASDLFENAGFDPFAPPARIDLAIAILGRAGIRYIGRAGSVGSPMMVCDRGRTRICLHRGASIEENEWGLALGLARWDASRGGPCDPAELALALAIPEELLASLRANGWTVADLAEGTHLPIAIVEQRVRVSDQLQSARRLRSAGLREATMSLPDLVSAR